MHKTSWDLPLLSLSELFSSITMDAKWEDTGFPRVKQKADNETLTVQFALAGYPREALHVEVQDDTLIVKGDKTKDEHNLFASRAFTWSRRDLYGQWALDKAEVTFENGALTITVPKKENKKPKLLEIK